METSLDPILTAHVTVVLQDIIVLNLAVVHAPCVALEHRRW
jgi:hypothetical protein